MDTTRGNRDLIAENAFLRQQLIVFKRQTPPPSLTPKDRGLLVLLASWVRGWQDALLVNLGLRVQPGNMGVIAIDTRGIVFVGSDTGLYRSIDDG